MMKPQVIGSAPNTRDALQDTRRRARLNGRNRGGPITTTRPSPSMLRVIFLSTFLNVVIS
jgi:hypothetical protein